MEKVTSLENVRNEALRADLERAMSTYDTVADAAHGRPHIENVIRASKMLNDRFRLPPDRVTAAAVLHDIGNTVDRKRHAEIGAEMAPQYLQSLPPRSRAAVVHAIREHRYSKGNPRSQLAKLINDADTVSDFTVPDDPDYFFRRLVQYRNSTGMPKEEVYGEALDYGRPWLQRALNGALRTQEAKEVFRPHLERSLAKTDNPAKFREFLAPMIEQEYGKTGSAETMYHGSPTKVDQLEPRGYHGDPQVPPSVFASPLREFALAYSGGKWDDRDIEQGLHSETDEPGTAKVELREMRPGVFDEVYQQPGYMYELPSESFATSPRHGTPWEQVSTNTVTPRRVEHIKNVAKELRASKNVEMLPYDEEESRRLIRSDRRVKRLMEMSPADREEYLSWYAEKMPEALAPDLEALRDKVSSAKKEFAPGIPAARKIDTIPSIKNKAWTLSVQQHDAKKAGKHYDVRLVDPGSQKAHSFAVPRGRLPSKGDRMLLAIQQPTHTADYALNFEGKIPVGTYGAGQVKIKLQEPVNVVKANADRIHFERPNGRGYVLFRTQGNNWGFKQKKN